MFFFLSKFLFTLSQPIAWVLVTMLWAWRKKSFKWLKISALLLIFFSNKFIFNTFGNYFEHRVTSDKLEQNHDFAIVLGGYMKADLDDDSYLNFSDAGSRLSCAVQLWRQGKIKKILLSGGDGSILKPQSDESYLAAQLCKTMGVPDSIIFRDSLSRNTFENAQFSKAIIDKLSPGSTSVLITSAFHIKRSLACCQKVGLDVVPVSSDFRTQKMYWYAPGTYLGLEPQNLSHWQSYVREMLGTLVYQLKGYN
jgi:uncharacterized SAM-binding protein YcdF (DUF218 family)